MDRKQQLGEHQHPTTIREAHLIGQVQHTIQARSEISEGARVDTRSHRVAIVHLHAQVRRELAEAVNGLVVLFVS